MPRTSCTTIFGVVVLIAGDRIWNAIQPELLGERKSPLFLEASVEN